MIRYLFFDLDGTLVDTSPGILQSISSALKELGMDSMQSASMKRFIGPPLKAAFMDVCGMGEESANDATKIFRKYYNCSGKFNCALYDGMEESLKALQSAGFTLAVATSKPTLFAEQILNHLNISCYFDQIVGSNMDNSRSNKQEIIQYLLDGYHIEHPDTVYMIGDKAQDLLGAQCCGVRGIGVTYGYGTAEELKAAPYEVLLNTPKEIVSYFM